MRLSVLIPVLGRPQNVEPLISSLRESSADEHEVLFLCSPGDTDEIMACHRSDARMLIATWKPEAGDYAKKMNLGFEATHNEWMLLASDDVSFRPGWDTALLEVADRTGAAVIGSNDLGNPQVYRKMQFSTHPLVNRYYVEQLGASADGPGVLCHEGYDHNFVDRELWDLAEARGLAAFSLDAKIEHLHPHWGKNTLDPTYDKGLKHFHDDQRLYWSRCHLWGKELQPREQNELARWERRMAKQK